MMTSDLENKVDAKLAKFNALNYKDKKFVRQIALGDRNKAEVAKDVYNLKTLEEGDIKAMTTMSRVDIAGALREINVLQATLLKSRILHMGDEALDKVYHLMINAEKESNRLKAATTITKMGVDLIKESEKNNPKDQMKLIINNPSGNVNVNFDSQKIMDSFANDDNDDDDIIDADYEDVPEEKEEHTPGTKVDLNPSKVEF